MHLIDALIFEAKRSLLLIPFIFCSKYALALEQAEYHAPTRMV